MLMNENKMAVEPNQKHQFQSNEFKSPYRMKKWFDKNFINKIFIIFFWILIWNIFWIFNCGFWKNVHEKIQQLLSEFWLFEFFLFFRSFDLLKSKLVVWIWIWFWYFSFINNKWTNDWQIQSLLKFKMKILLIWKLINLIWLNILKTFILISFILTLIETSETFVIEKNKTKFKSIDLLLNQFID